MSLEHLSEEQIQAYLDAQPLEQDQNVRQHLEGCEACRQVLSQYRLLYGELGREHEVQLSTDFTAVTMARIKTLPPPAQRSDSGIILLGVGGAVTILAALTYLGMFKAILQYIGGILGKSLIGSPSFVSGVREFIAPIGGSLPILLFAGLILIAVEVIDRHIVKHKTGKIYSLSL